VLSNTWFVLPLVNFLSLVLINPSVVNKICGLRPAHSSTIECYVAAKVQEGDELYERKSDRTKGSSDFEWQQNLER
jgi:hypothetical protein